MNKAYRIVWNARTNTWTAVQENAKAKGKSSSGRVSAEPATLGRLGLKSSRFVCTALASALMMTAGYANAGPGIFINDGNDDGCIVTSDESARRNALFFLSNNNLEWAAGQASGGSMPSANAFRNKCSPTDAASQTNRALFHGDAGGAGSKHLSLGGRLDVNSGIIGLGDRAAGNNSIRIGSGNTLQAANSQSNSVAIGNDVETKAAMAVGIGPTAKANGQQSVAVGNSVEASGNFSVAIGTSARANAAQTVALGNNANAAGEDALAIGRSANAQAKDSIAFGRSSQAAAKGVAIGSEAKALVPNSVALGSDTVAVAAADQSGTKNVNGLNYTYVGNSANSSVTVGNRQIKQVGAGEVLAASTDAINGSQLYATQNVIGNIGKGVATNLGGGAALKSDGTFTAPTYNLTDASGNAVAKNNVGDALDVLNSRMNTVGTPVALNSNPSTGQVAAPTAADANKAATAGSVATAVNNAVSALESKGLQIDADSGTVDTVALGETVKYAGDANIKTKVNNNQIDFSLADNLNVTSIMTGDSKLDTDGLTITGGPSVTKTGINAGGKTITNVAAGTVSATSTDAATGSQLHKIANSTATHLGGGSAVQADGSISAPTYALTNASGAPTNYSNVGDALTALNARTNAANAGWKFQVNSGAEETIKPNDTVGFKDGTNIAITNNGKDITIATNPNLTADSLTINGNGPVINGNGINTNGKNIDMGNNGKITNLTSGNVAAGDNSAVTGGAVNTAINTAINTAVTDLKDAGFKIGADSGTDDTVKLGETVKYAGDANIKTTVTDNQIGFSLADNLNVTSITTGDSKLDTNGLTITGGPSVTKTGINAGGKTITNVAAGTVSATSTDAATGGQVYGALNNVKNVLGSNVSIDGSGNLSGNNIGGTGKTTFSDAIAAAYSKADAANAGWKFQVNSGAAETIKPNDTVGFKDGTNIAITNNGKDITIATNPNLTADSLTINGNGPVINGNGISTNGKNIDMGNSGKITNLADGSIAAGSKDAITGGQLHTALNNISNAATNLIGTTQPDIVTYDVSGNKADNTNNVKQAIDKMNNGGIKFFHVNDGTGTQNTAGTQPATEDSSASGRYGAAVGYQAKASGESGVAIGKGAQATAKNTISIGTGNIVSGEGSGAIGDPTTITGAGTYTIGNNNGIVSADAAGAFGNDNTLTGNNSRIIGNHNIVNTENTFVVGNNVSRATANSVVLGNNSSAERVHTTATTPGGNYTFGGLNDANVAGVNNVVGVVSVGQGAAGSDASVETRQIQNVAAGVVSATSTDAINGSQLYHTNQAILNGVNGNLANLGARIGQVEDAANAGTAAAMAMAGLPQAYLPGKSMMAVGGSVYRGESGYAIGYSTISDGGNWIIKGTATGNSRGHYGATAAVGYQW